MMYPSPILAETGHAVRLAVLLPTLNNARTLPAILERTRQMGLPIIVVNDGSTDSTGDILAQWTHSSATAPNGVMVLTHAQNRGKAAALRTGFSTAARAGFTHAVTIDTDGQLDPEEIPILADLARQYPQALIIGTRDETRADYPARSRIGRRLSNCLVWIECGQRVSDSQCGFRVYPLGLIETVQCSVEYFGFETEIITRAVWAGCKIVETPVNCRYLPPGQRVSHFRPWMDTLRGVAMHAGLIARALLPWRVYPQWPGVSSAENETRSGLGRFWEWISPARLWREMRADPIGRRDIAAGLALGVFIANLPIYGLQSVISLYAARRLRVHPLPVLAGSQISIPPIGPLLIAAGITLGHLLLHRSLPTTDDLAIAKHGAGHVIGPILLDWLMGGFVLGIAMAAIAFTITLRLLPCSEALAGKTGHTETQSPSSTAVGVGASEAVVGGG